MQDDRLNQLTERQRHLLGLVASGITSTKEIATKTGLVTGTIDNALQKAAKTLGVNGREAAAARFVELQENSNKAPNIRISPLPSSSDLTPIPVASPVRQFLRSMMTLLRGPSLGGEEFTLRWDQIALTILWVSGLGIVVISVLVLVVYGLFQTLS